MDGTRTDEIADGIIRISSCFPRCGAGASPSTSSWCWPTSPCCSTPACAAASPSTLAAIARVLAPDRLRWLSFGHVEADECGALGGYLAACPRLEVAFGAVGCAMWLDDVLAGRPARSLAPGEALDLGGRRIVLVPTPHAPHNQEAQVLYEETTATLLCGDLFGQLGAGPALTSDSLVDGALAPRRSSPARRPEGPCPTPSTTWRGFAARTLATMHGTSFEGDGAVALRGLARAWWSRPAPGGGSRWRRPRRPLRSWGRAAEISPSHRPAPQT